MPSREDFGFELAWSSRLGDQASEPDSVQSTVPLSVGSCYLWWHVPSVSVTVLHSRGGDGRHPVTPVGEEIASITVAQYYAARFGTSSSSHSISPVLKAIHKGTHWSFWRETFVT